jgi:hypothetical protein
MKLKILLFLFLSIFLIVSAAFAMAELVDTSSLFTAPWVMLMFCMCLIGLIASARKIFLDEFLPREKLQDPRI